MKHRRSQANGPRHSPSTAAAALGNGVEPLERRVLLSASPIFRPAPPPPVTPASTNIADVKQGPMANAGRELIDLYREYRRFKNARGADAAFASTVKDPLIFKGANVAITVRGRDTLESLVDRLRASNAELIYRSRTYSVVQAFVPIGQLHDLARDPQVATLRPIYRPETRQMGVSGNQADFVQKTDRMRRDFGIDGRGTTVGVISDSANRFDKGIPGSVATRDLPREVSVLLDHPLPNPLGVFGSPTDEGRAMLELIHDIAPGAALQFAAVGVSNLTFADAVSMLSAGGSEIIVDDIGLFDEPIYQPGVLEQAITNHVNGGGVFLSAAGNDADTAYEALTNFTKQGRHRFVDFDPGPAVDTRMRITSAGGTMRLWWDEPYNGVVGTANTDLDVYFYDATYGRLRAVANTNNIRTGVPFDSVFLPAGDYDVLIRVEDHVEGTPFPTRFRLMGEGMQNTEYTPIANPTAYGHPSHVDAIAVGAVPWFSPSENEDFSSEGPAFYTFDFGGNRLSTTLVLDKPDISGIDAVNTSFFGGDIPEDDDVLPNFFGTSAAAPNVAALVALIRQVQPDASQAEILAALRETAIPLNGSTGGFEEKGGFGLVDGLAAIDRFVSPPQVHITQVRPDPRVTPVDHLKIVFSQRVIGFDLSDLTLTRDGGPNLLTGAQTLQSTDGGRTWLLRNLRPLTEAHGSYTFTLIAQGSGIINRSTLALPLENGADETWQHMEFPGVPTPPGNLKAKVVDEGVVRLRWDDNSGNEDYFLVQRAEDKDFGVKLKSFRLPFDTTVFTDRVILPVGKRVFYRVRAVNNFSQFEQSTNVVEVFLPGRGEIVLDNESSSGVLVQGNWHTTSNTPGFLGDSYLDDGDAEKGEKSVRFTPNVPRTAEYFVYARWTRADNHATNVPIDVVHNGGMKRTITVDQRNSGGDGWVLLGKFRFESGRSGFVRFRTDGTDGLVTVDSVRFQPATAVG